MVLGLFSLIAAAIAVAGYRRWLGWLRQAVTVVLGLQLLLGIVVYAGGSRPQNRLHLLYGIVAVWILPAADRFASEAPPKPRAAVLAVGGLLTLGVIWRLVETG